METSDALHDDLDQIIGAGVGVGVVCDGRPSLR